MRKEEYYDKKMASAQHRFIHRFSFILYYEYLFYECLGSGGFYSGG